MKTLYPIRHKDGKTDKRYSIDLEWSGESRPTYVARFCGEWISAGHSVEDARAACAEYEERRWPPQA
jgi:hypothetical protein